MLARLYTLPLFWMFLQILQISDEFQDPEPALCIPQLEVVTLKPNNTEPMALYYPSGTRINRCGGCCTNPLTECQPIETKVKEFAIRKSYYNFEERRLSQDHTITVVEVEEHIKCKCNCIVQPMHCNNMLHNYNQSNCQCECKRKDLENKCYKKPKHRWDYKNCKCVCRNRYGCSTNSQWYTPLCKCMTEARLRNFLEYLAHNTERPRI